ncbi:2'-5' RNA ligase [Sphingomonas jinjuensis]|uniref:RNA 2',3'-cyclic phosphodiesterase n=1 Tax=Sphingomonas jinjuensis TaxID=535907 RepID=A0A840FGF2_9SPHN|nr:RNA 2',3'-cyclic phosphodiesterase [Sphingomonas jinjuensis]MBB4154737.1 2'-5' RNA ligase [Sphingomonas jinjuensis]
MPRLFVALRPPPPIREGLLDIMDDVPQARWQDDDQLHLTLRFVGDVEPWQGDDLAAALAGIHAPAPTVALAGVGRFEHRGRTDTLWADVTGHDALAHLARKVEQACQRAGLPPEQRAFRPHITVARIARSAGAAPEIDHWLGRHARLASAPFTMPHLILYESVIGRAGATYEAVMRWPLGTAPDAPGF